MQSQHAQVDGFRFLPPKLSAWIRSYIPDEPYEGAIPFAPPEKPMETMRLALVTSAGISLKSDPPFDMTREMSEPEYGDPTHRTIPRETQSAQVDVNHLHINTDYIKEDINVMLPLERLVEFESEGLIGELAPSAYSFYGFQWQGDAFLKTAIEPMVAQMVAEKVDGALLTPA